MTIDNGTEAARMWVLFEFLLKGQYRLLNIFDTICELTKFKKYKKFLWEDDLLHSWALQGTDVEKRKI